MVWSVKEVLPTMIIEHFDGYLGINSDPLIWCTIRSIQELYSKYKLNLEEIKKRERLIKRLKENQTKIETMYKTILDKL